MAYLVEPAARRPETRALAVLACATTATALGPVAAFLAACELSACL